MIKFGKWIAKHKVIIVIISMLLLIPSFLGMAATRVNYDILSYLPESLETVEGRISWWMNLEWVHSPGSRGRYGIERCRSIKRKIPECGACKRCSVV